MKKTYTIIKKEALYLYDRKTYWENEMNKVRPFCFVWQQCKEMVEDYEERLNNLFATVNPAYRTLFYLEISRKSAS